MFEGIITPVITVLDKNGNQDFVGQKKVIERLIANKVNGILIMGSIGEFFALTMQEKKDYIEFAVKTVNKRIPVLVGTGNMIQSDVIELSDFAEKTGADAVVVISPYYFKLDDETLYNYYAAIARNISLPIMIYNFPDRTAVNINPQLVLRLADEFNNIVGIKDTVDAISHTRELIQTVKAKHPDFRILSGYDEYLIPNLLAGGDGVIGGMSNVVPNVFSEILIAYKNKNMDKVIEGQRKISLLMNLYNVSNPFVAAIKGAVAAQGGDIKSYVKQPSQPLKREQLDKIEEILSKIDNIV